MRFVVAGGRCGTGCVVDACLERCRKLTNRTTQNVSVLPHRNTDMKPQLGLVCELDAPVSELHVL